MEIKENLLPLLTWNLRWNSISLSLSLYPPLCLCVWERARVDTRDYRRYRREQKELDVCMCEYASARYERRNHKCVLNYTVLMYLLLLLGKLLSSDFLLKYKSRDRPKTCQNFRRSSWLRFASDCQKSSYNS